MAHSPFRILTVFCLLCACTAAFAKPHGSSGHAQKPEDPNLRFIRQAYAYMDSGWDTLNGAVMMAYMTQDFQYTTMDGSATGRTEYAELISRLLRDKFVITDKDGYDFDVHSAIKNVAVSGQDLVIDRIVVVELHSGTGDPRQSGSGLLQVKYHDTWMQFTNGWYMKSEAIRYVSLKEHESFHTEIETRRVVR
jgi:hypothetical protein